MISQTTAARGTVSLFHDEVRFHRSLHWGAILAGTVTAVAVHLLLLALGAGIGLATFTPLTDQNPGENFSMGAAIAWSLCALVALFSGGWIAGSFSAGPKSGCLHGILVWSMVMVLTFLLVTAGGGLALGGAVKALGTGLGMTGQAAATSAAGVVSAGTRERTEQIGSFIDEAVKTVPTNAAPNMVVRAKREMGFSVTRLFAPGNDINSVENQAAVVKALTEYTGVNEADAKKTVDDWVTSYKNLKVELEKTKVMAEQKARESAERAAKDLAAAATVSFFALIIGLVITMCGGIGGAKHTYRHTTLGIISE